MLFVCFLFVLFVMLRMEPSMLVGACQFYQSHIPATVHYYNKEEFLVCFCFCLFGAFFSHQHLTDLNKSHIIYYLVSASK